MSKLLTILRAAHCRSTHHYFAIDALSQVSTVRGKHLVDLLLRNHARYLVGAKAPDVAFRDFTNHVIHVENDNWGGAAKSANRWYAQLLSDLDSRKFGAAAYAAGVLSHYFTDPLMPLHTGQSDIEAVIHRPMEWSICNAYEEILAEFKSGSYNVTFQLANYGEWLEEAILVCARVAHQFYEPLVANFDLTKCVDDPPSGLNRAARESLAQLFGLAIFGWARILERAAEETHCEFPSVKLTMTTLLAAIDAPAKTIANRFAAVAERRAVASIVREYEQTGTVEKHLPNEIRIVRQQRLTDGVSDQPRLDSEPQGTSEINTLLVNQPISQQVEIESHSNVPLAAPPNQDANQSETPDSPPMSIPFSFQADGNLPAIPNGLTLRSKRAEPTITFESNVIEAPSIGPSTAQRLARVGIQTISDLLGWNAAVLSVRLKTSWIMPSTVQDWKDQARMVCQVEGLRGYEAQLLTGAGVREVSSLAIADPHDLLDAILAVCATPAGQSILRDNSNPDLAEVSYWIAEAQLSEGQSADSRQQRAA